MRHTMVARSLAAIATGVALAACGSPEPSPASSLGSASASSDATGPSGSPAAGATSPSTPPTASTEPTSWSAVIFDRPDTPAGLSGILATGDRLVAVGMEGFAGAVWTMESGGDWEPQPGVPAADGPDAYLNLVDVVAGPGRLVAAGIIGRQNSEAAGTVIWTSGDDGVTWEQAARMDGVLLGSLAAGEPGIVATGSATGIAQPVAISVWFSSDGVEWTEADTGDLGTGAIRDAVWTGDQFVGVGHLQGATDEGLPGPATAAAWTSADGQAWEPMWAEGPDGSFFHAVQATGAGLVVIGAQFDAASPSDAIPHAWRSTDGTSWEGVALAPAPAQPLSLAASADGLVAVGFTDESAQRLALWTSVDGVEWTFAEEVAAEAEGALRSAVVLADRIVAVGGTQGASEADAHPIVVTGPLP